MQASIYLLTHNKFHFLANDKFINTSKEIVKIEFLYFHLDIYEQFDLF